MIKTQIWKALELLEIEETPKKKKIISKSKRTNKTARKKNGALKNTLESNLSNPDSRGERLSSFKGAFLERKIWIIKIKEIEIKSPIIKIIMI